MRAIVSAFIFVALFSAIACAQDKGGSKHLYILVVNNMTKYNHVNILNEVTTFISNTPNPGDSVVVISGSTGNEILTYTIPNTIHNDINSNLRLKFAQKGSWETFTNAFPEKGSRAANLFDLTKSINSVIPAADKRIPVVCFVNMTKPLMEAGASDFLQPTSPHHLPHDNQFSLCTAIFNIIDIDEKFNQAETAKAQALWSQYTDRLGAAASKTTSSRTFYQTISKGNGEKFKENCADRMILNKPMQTSQSLLGGSIVLTWDNPECDLDLYGKLGPELLCYKNPEASFGKHYRQSKNGNELLLITKADTIEIEVRHVNGPAPINARVVAKDRDNNVISSRMITQFQTSVSYRQPGNVLIIGSDSICKP